MASPASNKRRNVVSPKSAEKSALNLIAEEADSREAKSQEVLIEARKIRSSERMKEKDVEMDNDEMILENGHGFVEKKNSQPDSEAANKNNNESTCDTSINNSPTTPPTPEQQKTTLQQQPATTNGDDTHERFKQVMLLNAQLDNEGRMLKYQTDLLKDELETANENSIQLKNKIQKLKNEKTKLDLDLKDMHYQYQTVHLQLKQRDALIKENGFSMVMVDGNSTPTRAPTTMALSNGGGAGVNGNCGSAGDSSCAILSSSQLELFSEYTGSLGSKIQQLFDDKNTALEMNKRLQRELEEARTTISNTPNPPSSSSSSSSPNLTGDNLNPLEGGNNQLIETKYKLKKAEQEITSLQGAVTRLETQLNRYKTSAEELEKSEDELKVDKRKLQIELRESRTQIDELQMKNSHLMKRVEKMKANRIQEALQ